MKASQQTANAIVDALRVQAKALDALADVLEVAATGDGIPNDTPPLPAAFGAQAAADYCGLGPTLLRERGPAPRYVGGRAVWLRDDLDQWLRELPTESTHRRGHSRMAKESLL